MEWCHKVAAARHLIHGRIGKRVVNEGMSVQATCLSIVMPSGMPSSWGTLTTSLLSYLPLSPLTGMPCSSVLNSEMVLL